MQIPTAASPPALAGEGLTLDYGGGPAVVHGVSIALRPGTVTALLGPNGSGKSTVLRALARLHPVRSGETRLVDGQGERRTDLLGAKELARALTLFTQTRAAPQGLSVRDVVAFGRHPHRRRFGGLADADRAAIDHAMRLTGIAEFARRAVGELSGGEMQRVAIARAIVNRPAVLLADEPTGNLDPETSEEIVEVLDRVHRRGTTVVMATHDRHIVDAMRRRVIEFDNGRLVRNDEYGVYGIG